MSKIRPFVLIECEHGVFLRVPFSGWFIKRCFYQDSDQVPFFFRSTFCSPGARGHREALAGLLQVRGPAEGADASRGETARFEQRLGSAT